MGFTASGNQLPALGNMIDPLLTPDEVAAALKVSPRSLRRMTALRRLKVGGLVRYSERSVREYIASCAEGATEEKPRKAYTLKHIRLSQGK